MLEMQVPSKCPAWSMSFLSKGFLILFEITFTSAEQKESSDGVVFWIGTVTAFRMSWSLATWDHSLIEFLIVLLLTLVLVSGKLLIVGVIADFDSIVSALAKKKTFHVLASWCSDYQYSTTSFNEIWTQVKRRFKPCLQCDKDSRCWGSLTMVPARNKAKRLLSVNHITKRIHHHHHHHHHYHHQCLWSIYSFHFYFPQRNMSI